MLVLEWKERVFIEKVNWPDVFVDFPRPHWCTKTVHQYGVSISFHTKLYKGAWNVSANYSETVDHKDLRLGQLLYVSVFYNISFSWLFPRAPDGFQFIFLLRDSENDLLAFRDLIGNCEKRAISFMIQAFSTFLFFQKDWTFLNCEMVFLEISIRVHRTWLQLEKRFSAWQETCE